LPKKLTTDEFKRRAILKHGSKYDYSEVHYVNSTIKLKIICATHGEFTQLSKVHLRGSGCPRCAGNIMNQELFNAKAVKTHGLKYDYSEVKYINSQINVSIICPIHGVFEQEPASHLRGRGCPWCAGNVSNLAHFITKANVIHQNKFDYSLAEYTGNKNKIIIICPIHGEFKQRPNGHLNGWGCKKCGTNISAKLKLKTNKNTFIDRASSVHSGKYIYSKVNYMGAKKSVTIICPDHGEFKQCPNNHINGAQGCPECANENKTFDFVKKYTLNEVLGASPGIFYKLKFRHISGFEFLKIGITSKSIKKRYNIKLYKDYVYTIIEEIQTTNIEAALMEREFIKTTKLKKFKFPDGIDFVGRSECYNLNYK